MKKVLGELGGPLEKNLKKQIKLFAACITNYFSVYMYKKMSRTEKKAELFKKFYMKTFKTLKIMRKQYNEPILHSLLFPRTSRQWQATNKGGNMRLGRPL